MLVIGGDVTVGFGVGGGCGLVTGGDGTVGVRVSVGTGGDGLLTGGDGVDFDGCCGFGVVGVGLDGGFGVGFFGVTGLGSSLLALHLSLQSTGRLTTGKQIALDFCFGLSSKQFPSSSNVTPRFGAA